MKQVLALFILLFLSFNTFSQVTFEPGYIIDNSGQKTICLIKNNDWKNNPESFDYKINEAATVLEGNSGTTT